MLRRCQRHGQLFQLGLGDLVRHLGSVPQSHLGEVLQSRCLRRLGGDRLDEVHLLHLDAGRLDEVRLLHLDAGRLGVLGDPCPGSKRTGCCLDEP